MALGVLTEVTAGIGYTEFASATLGSMSVVVGAAATAAAVPLNVFDCFKNDRLSG